MVYAYSRSSVNTGRFNWPYLLEIIRRLSRVLPAYIFVMMFYYSVYLKLGSGQRWGSDEGDVRHCEHMWPNLLFIGNFYG